MRVRRISWFVRFHSRATQTLLVSLSGTPRHTLENLVFCLGELIDVVDKINKQKLIR
jgi:hypothetical protein